MHCLAGWKQPPEKIIKGMIYRKIRVLCGVFAVLRRRKPGFTFEHPGKSGKIEYESEEAMSLMLLVVSVRRHFASCSRTSDK